MAAVEAPPLGDAELVAQVAAGDRPALAELYRRHAGWLTMRLNRRCGDGELVDTAVQDTFVAVWRGARRYQARGEVGAWIWGIGVRRLIDQLRKHGGRPVAVDEPPADAAPSAEDSVLRDLGYGDVGDAFRRLSPELQQVLEAVVLDGLSTKEAGTLLGIPQGTVKTRLMRARADLREELA
ncbi:MAG: RNA polymerase sigma factor [Actinomycetota bacterium]